MWTKPQCCSGVQTDGCDGTTTEATGEIRHFISSSWSRSRMVGWERRWPVVAPSCRPTNQSEASCDLPDPCSSSCSWLPAQRRLTGGRRIRRNSMARDRAENTQTEHGQMSATVEFIEAKRDAKNRTRRNTGKKKKKTWHELRFGPHSLAIRLI